MCIKKPTFRAFIKAEFYSNVVATLSRSFLDYLTEGRVMNLPEIWLIVLFNALPIAIGLINSTLKENCSNAIDTGDSRQQARGEIITYGVGSIIMHVCHTVGFATGNLTVDKLNQAVLPVVAYAGAKLVKGILQCQCSPRVAGLFQGQTSDSTLDGPSGLLESGDCPDACTY